MNILSIITRRTFIAAAVAAALHLLPPAVAAGSDEANPSLPCELNSKLDPRDAPWTHFGWQKHGVVRLNGSEARQTLPAELYFMGGEWEYNNSQMPYLVYMPERKRLILAASVDKPAVKATAVFSDDFGKTWTKPKWMHTDAAGNPDLGAATQLTYLGNGKLICGENRYWSSTDYGQTWSEYAPVPIGSDGKAMYQWDPMLVDKDSQTGKVTRLVETRYKQNGTFGTPEYFSQGCVRFSTDEGKTWSKEIDVPQWKGTNEIMLCRARNGDLVAACRTDLPKQYKVGYDDQYSGLATSISKDNGYTWSELNHLYDWGRHQPHMIVMPNGDIVMTYVVRNGYVSDKKGLRRFGIEAVLSRDNGRTWDLDHKYILASNTSIMKGDRENWGSPQSTSNVLLPDGSLLTVFGTGVRNMPAQKLWKMDVVLVKWQPGSEPVNSEDTLRKAPFQSDLRNKFDLDSVKESTMNNQVPGNWSFTDCDAKLAEEIQPNLPRKMFDFHAHIYRVDDMHVKSPDFLLQGPRVASVAQWRKHIGRQVGEERLQGGLFMPYISPTCDITAANEFLFEQLQANPGSRGLLLVAPNSPREKVKEWLSKPGIVGFKPYYMLSTETPVSESSIEGYAPDWMWRMADECGLIMTIHLVRKGALSDAGNQAYLQQQCTKYPRAKIVLAHCGRGFHAPNTLKGLKGISGLKNVWFDTAALCESDSIVAVLKAFGVKKLLWGTDFSVSEIRGKAITIGDNFYWLTPDVPGWKEIASCNPTLIGLESLRAVCEAADCLDLKESDRNDIFYGNAVRLLKIAE